MKSRADSLIFVQVLPPGSGYQNTGLMPYYCGLWNCHPSPIPSSLWKTNHSYRSFPWRRIYENFRTDRTDTRIYPVCTRYLPSLGKMHIVLNSVAKSLWPPPPLPGGSLCLGTESGFLLWAMKMEQVLCFGRIIYHRFSLSSFKRSGDTKTLWPEPYTFHASDFASGKRRTGGIYWAVKTIGRCYLGKI